MTEHLKLGITFTFGGLAVDPNTAAMLDSFGNKIPNLYGAGEIVGGIASSNYAGGRQVHSC